MVRKVHKICIDLSSVNKLQENTQIFTRISLTLQTNCKILIKVDYSYLYLTFTSLPFKSLRSTFKSFKLQMKLCGELRHCSCLIGKSW